MRHIPTTRVKLSVIFLWVSSIVLGGSVGRGGGGAGRHHHPAPHAALPTAGTRVQIQLLGRTKNGLKVNFVNNGWKFLLPTKDNILVDNTNNKPGVLIKLLEKLSIMNGVAGAACAILSGHLMYLVGTILHTYIYCAVKLWIRVL